MAENRIKSRHEKKGVKMRLNRVLQLTAAVTIALAASIYTISCSEDGAAGADGAGCTISGSSAPYTVTCGGVEVGLLNGVDGEIGSVGPQGQQGKSCSLTPSGVSYTVSCGGSYQGILSGCVATKAADSTSSEAVINCGPTKISLCNSVVFDPTVSTCKLGGGTESAAFCGGYSESDSSGAGVLYDKRKQYCGFKDSAAFVAGTPTVLDLCYNSWNGSSNVLFSDDGTHSPNKAVLNITTDTAWVLASYSSGWGIPSPALDWQGQYCMVDLQRTVSNSNGTLRLVEVKHTATPGETAVPGGDHISPLNGISPLPGDSTAFCNGKKEKFNENTWKGEYCGFASATAKLRSKVTTACGDGTMPHENFWDEGYCSIPLDTAQQHLTTISYDYCGPTLRVAAGARTAPEVVWAKRVKINASTVQGILPAGSFKNEYCGYSIKDWQKTLASKVNFATSAGTGYITGDTLATAKAYIVVSGNPDAASLAQDTLYLTKLTGACTNYTPGTTTIYNAGPNARNAYDFSIATAGAVGTSAFGTAAPRKWLAQYCQGQNANDVKLTVPAPTAPQGYLNFTDFCTVDSAAVYGAGVTLTGTNTVIHPTVGSLPPDRTPSALGSTKVGGKINEGSYKGQYCTYETLANFGTLKSDGNMQTGKKATVSKANAICDDGGKPNEALAANYGDYAAAAALISGTTSTWTGKNYWKNEFCAPSNGITVKRGINLAVVGSDSKPRFRQSTASGWKLFDLFCPKDTSFGTISSTGDAKILDSSITFLSKLQGLKKANILDSNSAVKKEYCGFASKAKMEGRISGATGAWTAATANPEFAKLTTICGNLSKPNEAGFTVTIGTTVVGNPTTVAQATSGDYVYWKNEYCQYNFNTKQTETVGIDVSGSAGNYIRDADILTKFCPGDTSLTVVGGTAGQPATGGDYGNAAFFTKFQATSVATLNKNSNLKQYCGFSSKANLENEATSTTTNEAQGPSSNGTNNKVSRPKFAVLTTRCGDFKGINAARDDIGTHANYTTSWQNDYCQADENDRGLTKRVGGPGAYCGEDVDFTKPASFAAYNKDAWKGEYCFDDFKVGVCYGGQVPATGSVSTDPDSKRCAPF